MKDLKKRRMIPSKKDVPKIALAFLKLGFVNFEYTDFDSANKAREYYCALFLYLSKGLDFFNEDHPQKHVFVEFLNKKTNKPKKIDRYNLYLMNSDIEFDQSFPEKFYRDNAVHIASWEEEFTFPKDRRQKQLKINVKLTLTGIGRKLVDAHQSVMEKKDSIRKRVYYNDIKIGELVDVRHPFGYDSGCEVYWFNPVGAIVGNRFEYVRLDRIYRRFDYNYKPRYRSGISFLNRISFRIREFWLRCFQTK